MVCSICLDVVKEPKKLSCSHVFCKLCIDNWIKIKKSCPCCRTMICKKLAKKQCKIENENEKFLEHLYYIRDVYQQTNNSDMLYQVYRKIDICEECQRINGKYIRLHSLFEK